MRQVPRGSGLLLGAVFGAIGVPVERLFRLTDEIKDLRDGLNVKIGWKGRSGVRGADVDASGYLYTIATVGMTFAGLSVLTMILRQMLGGQMTKWDSFVTRTWIQLGFMTTFGSILLPLLLLFGAPAPLAWRISSGVMAVMLGSWALTFPRRRRAVNSTRLPLQVVIFSLAMDIAALALAANALVVPGELLAGVYAAAVTAILIGAGMLFLFAFVHWYDATIGHEQLQL